jgi:hypothetical protein
MTPIESFVIVAAAALIHASFQLSVSMLTLLSGHAIGAKRSHLRLLKLSGAFSFGAIVMTVLMLSTIALFSQILLRDVAVTELVWVVTCGLLMGLGVAVWIFYYRKGQGTTLWLPRSLARFLATRAKSTSQSAEAFSLGLTSVLAELLFIFAPMLLAALALVQLTPSWQLVGIALYAALSLSTLLGVHALIGSGHKLSRIQRWREDNKTFLQFVSGGGLIVLGFYVYVEQVLTPTVMAAAGGM